MMSIPISPLPWVGDNLLLLDELRVELERLGIAEPVLLRASEQSKLARVLEYGTDRAGHPGDRRWDHDPAIAHVDVILATTPEQNRIGEADPLASTSLKKFALHEAPLLLVYAAAAFEALPLDKHWRFRAPERKHEALRAVFPITKLALPDGWFSPQEGLGYRSLVERALGPGARGVVVEVGCWLGRSTTYVARLCRARGARLIAVDAWAGSSDRFDAAYRARLATRDIEGEFRAHLAALGVEVECRKQLSLDAAAGCEPGSLDLVFLDASHDYASLAAELAAWLPCVRAGGRLAGHDFCDRHEGVVAAVSELADRIGRAIERGPGSLWSLET